MFSLVYKHLLVSPFLIISLAETPVHSPTYFSAFFTMNLLKITTYTPYLYFLKSHCMLQLYFSTASPLKLILSRTHKNFTLLSLNIALLSYLCLVFQEDLTLLIPSATQKNPSFPRFLYHLKLLIFLLLLLLLLPR